MRQIWDQFRYDMAHAPVYTVKSSRRPMRVSPAGKSKLKKKVSLIQKGIGIPYKKTYKGIQKKKPIRYKKSATPNRINIIDK